MKPIDTAQWYPVLMRKDFALAMNVTETAVDDPDVAFYENYTCASQRNYTGYCNPELDKLIAEAAAAPIDKQKALYSRYAGIVARDINEITLTNARYFEAVSTKLKNIDSQFNVAFNTHPNWQEVWIPKDQQN